MREKNIKESPHETVTQKIAVPSEILIICLTTIIFSSPSAFSGETCKFERMRPTLEQPWYFSCPYDLASDGDAVYVADMYNRRIQKF